MSQITKTEDLIHVFDTHVVLVRPIGVGIGSFHAEPQAWKYDKSQDAVEIRSSTGTCLGYIPRQNFGAAEVKGSTIELNDGSQFGNYRYQILKTEPLKLDQTNDISDSTKLLSGRPVHGNSPLLLG